MKSVAPQLRELALQVSAIESKNNRQSDMIEKCLDMHNELVDWACNTADTESSEQVLKIVEKYLQEFRTDQSKDSVFALAPPAPSGVALGSQSE